MYLHLRHQSESDPDASHGCYLGTYVMFGTLVLIDLLRCFPFGRAMACVWHVVGVLSNEVCVYNFMCQSGNSGFCHRESGEICGLQIGRVGVRQRCEKLLRKMCEEWELLRCQCEPKKLKLAF